jgi:hypothetical protein
MLGLGLGLTFKQATSSFSRSSLSLTGFWKASYSGSPWVGSESDGISGSNDLSEATNPPSTGAAINGLTPADFDGTNDKLTAEGTLDTYLNADEYSGWALINVDAIGTDVSDTTQIYENDCVLSTQPSAYWMIYLRSSGLVGIGHYAGGAFYKVVTAAISTGSWALVQWKYNGTEITIRVNDGAWATPVAAGSITLLENVLALGVNYNAGHCFNGKVLEVATSDVALSDDQFDSVLDDVRSTYGLALT